MALTNTEDVEAESVVDRLVDQLVRHAVKPDMSSQRDSSSTLPLQNTMKMREEMRRNEHKTGGKSFLETRALFNWSVLDLESQ